MIFKLQIPVPPFEISQILVYSEDRDIEDILPVTDEVLSLFPPECYKIFVEGTYENGEIDITRIVDWQDAEHNDTQGW